MNDTWKEKCLSDDELNSDSAGCEFYTEEIAAFLQNFSGAGFEEFIDDNFDIVCTDGEY